MVFRWREKQTEEFGTVEIWQRQGIDVRQARGHIPEHAMMDLINIFSVLECILAPRKVPYEQQQPVR